MSKFKLEDTSTRMERSRSSLITSLIPRKRIRISKFSRREPVVRKQVDDAGNVSVNYVKYTFLSIPITFVRNTSLNTRIMEGL